MINRLVFRPNLVDCILEERIAPAIANLASIILTTGGFTLIESFPGTSTSGQASAVSTSAASVSGVATPTSFYVTGPKAFQVCGPAISRACRAWPLG
jgi:hypothetical protein